MSEYGYYEDVTELSDTELDYKYDEDVTKLSDTELDYILDYLNDTEDYN